MQGTTAKKSEAGMSVGVLARRTGLAVSAIRYYEEVRLIPSAKRPASGHRVYDGHVQDVLTLIRHCRELGFSIDRTRELVSLSSSGERDCMEARQIAQVQLDAVRAKLAEFQELESSLSRFVSTCTEQCAGGPAADCTILKELSPGEPAEGHRRGCCK